MLCLILHMVNLHYPGEHIKNWRKRYFILREDGTFFGFKAKPEHDMQDPLNNFTVRGEMPLCVFCYCIRSNNHNSNQYNVYGAFITVEPLRGSQCLFNGCRTTLSSH